MAGKKRGNKVKRTKMKISNPRGIKTGGASNKHAPRGAFKKVVSLGVPKGFLS